MSIDPSIISLWDSTGSVELTSPWDIFSSTPQPRGATSSIGIFRVYNNYSGTANIANALAFQLFLGTNAQVPQIIDQQTTVSDFSFDSVFEGTVEIKCVFASELSADPSVAWSVFDDWYSGSTFDKILSSGALNFNEYQIRINVPASGTRGRYHTSGTITPTIHGKWDSEGIYI